MATLGERIKALRLRQGLTQSELAERCKITQAAVSRLESGSMKDVETAIAKRLARALGTSVDHLIGTFEDEDAELLAAVAS
jgi:transcriptional regulator with XRE-family HTH domain